MKNQGVKVLVFYVRSKNYEEKINDAISQLNSEGKRVIGISVHDLIVNLLWEVH